MARPAGRDTGVTGVLVRTGVVTACCGGHRPAPGEASTCLCCPECITNAEVQDRHPDVNAAEARANRATAAFWSRAVRGATRHLTVLVLREALEKAIRPLDEAFRHAAAIPPPKDRPDVCLLDTACQRYEEQVWAAAEAARVRQQLHDELAVGFTGAVPA